MTMTTHKQTATAGRGLSLAQRRAHLTLPLAERRQRLAAQAVRMAAHYEQASEQTERFAWQGGDTVEP
jgi:hypothetical protein